MAEDGPRCVQSGPNNILGVMEGHREKLSLWILGVGAEYGGGYVQIDDSAFDDSDAHSVCLLLVAISLLKCLAIASMSAMKRMSIVW